MWQYARGSTLSVMLAHLHAKTGQCVECTEAGKVTDLPQAKILDSYMASLSFASSLRNFHYKFLPGAQAF